MARQLSDLTVQLSGAPVSFRWPDNEAFLNGTQPHPQPNFLEDLIVGLIAGIVLLPIIGLMSGFFILIWMASTLSALWHTPLAVETTAMIDGYQDQMVSYHYYVGSTRYDKIEPASRFEPTWDSVEPRQPVVYLIFDPSYSSLASNVRPETYPGFDVAINALTPLLPAFIVWQVWQAMRNYKRRIVLRGEATHLLEGRIFKVRNTWKSPLITYTYLFLSPTTGAEISDHFSIDRSNPRNGDFQQGTMVAILYRDDKLHAIL
jgi:hypothetical protein